MARSNLAAVAVGILIAAAASGQETSPKDRAVRAASVRKVAPSSSRRSARPEPTIEPAGYLDDEAAAEPMEAAEADFAPNERRMPAERRQLHPDAVMPTEPTWFGPDQGWVGDGCEDGSCGGGCGGFCRHGCLGSWYGDLEYLAWWTKGMEIPPLVVLVNNGAADVIYGNQAILQQNRNGGRVRLGKWFDCCENFGIEGDYFQLGTIRSNFLAQSDAAGNPQIGRPFVEANTGQDFIEEVSTPGRLAGSVRVDAQGNFSSAGMRFRRNLCSEPICFQDPRTGCVQQGMGRTDVLLGYRYTNLNESLNIHESLTSLSAVNPGRFEIDDTFRTQNDFNGVEVGVLWQNNRGRWSADLLTKLAVGNVHETVRISGQTVTTGANNAADNGVRPGGLLTQTTNIGDYTRDQFAFIPEVGLTLGYQLTPRWRLQAGYTFIYWSRVVRPGDQIDLTVNQNLLPERQFPLQNPVFAGPARPAFTFQETDFWAQGINVGAHFNF